jgi:hypothetical protein
MSEHLVQEEQNSAIGKLSSKEDNVSVSEPNGMQATAQTTVCH